MKDLLIMVVCLGVGYVFGFIWGVFFASRKRLCTDSVASRYTYTVQWRDDEDRYVLSVGEFPRIKAYGGTALEALSRGIEAIAGCLEVYRQDGLGVPSPGGVLDTDKVWMIEPTSQHLNRSGLVLGFVQGQMIWTVPHLGLRFSLRKDAEHLAGAVFSKVTDWEVSEHIFA